MKLLLVLVLTLASFNRLNAQQKGEANQLPAQLKKVLSMASKDFISLRGELVEEAKDII